MKPGLHRPAAAGAAIADGVEAAQHRILEESVVHVAAFVLGAQDLHRLFRRDPAGTVRVVLGDETGERLADNEADVERLAGIGARGAAGALQDHDVIGVLQHDVAGAGVGEYLLQVGQADLFLDGDQLLGCLQWHDLAVVSIGEGDGIGTVGWPGRKQPGQPTHERPEDTGQRMLSGPDANVKVGPASIDVSVQPVKE